MTAARKMEVWPTSKSGSFARWDFSSQAWSGAGYGEDSIKLIVDGGEWFGCTEFDQCVHRDLSADEIASIRAEVELCGDPS
jgi:hypothetical protein